MTIVKIDGTDRTGDLKIQSLRARKKVQDPRQGRLVAEVATSGWTPTIGKSIDVLDEDGNTVIGGTIDNLKVTHFDAAAHNRYEIQIISNEFLAQKRTITREWANTDAGQIVRDIVDKVLTEEGVTKGDIVDGPNVVQFEANSGYINEILNTLSEDTGHVWRINADRSLDFQFFDSNPAAFALTDANGDKWENLTLSIGSQRDQYRNRQIVTGIEGILKERVEEIAITEDGTTEVPLEFEVENLNKVEFKASGDNSYTDETDKTVEAFRKHNFLRADAFLKVQKWIAAPGSEKLNLSFHAGTLDSGDSVRVTYEGRGKTAVVAEDSTEISNRDGIEEGSGIHTHVENSPFNAYEKAKDYARGLVRKHSKMEVRGFFETTETGLKPGQVFTNTDLSDWNVTDDLYIEEIEVRDIGDEAETLRRRVEVTNKEPGTVRSSLSSDDGEGKSPREDQLTVTPSNPSQSLKDETGSDQGPDSTDSELDTQDETPTAPSNKIWGYKDDPDELRLMNPKGGIVEAFDPQPIVNNNANFSPDSDPSGLYWDDANGVLCVLYTNGIARFNVDDPSSPQWDSELGAPPKLGPGVAYQSGEVFHLAAGGSTTWSKWDAQNPSGGIVDSKDVSIEDGPNFGIMRWYGGDLLSYRRRTFNDILDVRDTSFSPVETIGSGDHNIADGGGGPTGGNFGGARAGDGTHYASEGEQLYQFGGPPAPYDQLNNIGNDVDSFGGAKHMAPHDPGGDL